jgi:hypothetical protein
MMKSTNHKSEMELRQKWRQTTTATPSREAAAAVVVVMMRNSRYLLQPLVVFGECISSFQFVRYQYAEMVRQEDQKTAA